MMNARGPDRAPPPRSRLVIDAPIRMFHWLFAASFAGAYATAGSEHWRLEHVTLGYSMVALLVFRLLYGWLGPRQASLAPRARLVRQAPAWLRAIWQAARQWTLPRIDWRQGPPLVMAAPVIGLLVLTVPLTLTGYGAYNEWGVAFGGDWLAELHEGVGELFLAVVLAHVGLIAVVSLLRRRNLGRTMLTGRVAGAGPDLVRRNRRWLALLLFVGVTGFAGWHALQPADIEPMPLSALRMK